MPLETAAGCDPPLRPPSLEKVHTHLLYQEFATRTILPAIYSLFLAITVILLSRPRREGFPPLPVLFLALEHASWRVELKTVDCKWCERGVFCQMNHFKRIDGVLASLSNVNLFDFWMLIERIEETIDRFWQKEGKLLILLIEYWRNERDRLKGISWFIAKWKSSIIESKCP